MMRCIVVVLVLASTPALAQEIPDEATKVWALKKAYEMNGNSMVGWESIDLSNVRPEKVDVRPQKEFNEIDATASLEVQRPKKHFVGNICTRHGLKKVDNEDGTSWKCRKK